MPEIFDKNPSKLAVRLEELIPDWYPSYDALKVKMWRDRQRSNGRYGIRRLQEGKGLGNEVLIDYDSLPLEIREALGDLRLSRHAMDQYFVWNADAFRFYTDFRYGNGQALSDKHRDLFTLNASVLMAVRDYKIAHTIELSKSNRKPQKIYLWMANQCQSFQKSLQANHKAQHSLPPSERQFREVYDQFFADVETYNYESLVDKRLCLQNALLLTTKVKALLDSMFAKSGRVKPNKAKVAQMYQDFLDGKTEVIVNETGEAFNPEDFAPISGRTISKWLSEYESKAATLVLRSADRQQYQGLMKPSREMLLPTYAGAVLSIDDRQPPFEYAAGSRLWLYNAVDVASEVITVTVFGKNKEGMIMEFYRQALRNYTEMGVRLPYQLEAEMSLNSMLKDTILRPGVMFDVVHLIPNNARTKYIERINKEFRYTMEKGYQGWKGRPFAKDESNQPMPYDNIYTESKYIPYEQLVQQSLQVIEDWNNMEHSKHKGVSRWDYFVANQHPDLKPTNWRGILPHIGYMTKSSCNVGAVRLQGASRWIAEDGEILLGDALVQKLKMIEGQDLTVYWIDGNDGEVMKALAYIGDTYCCDLLPIPKYHRAVIEQTPQCAANKLIQDKYVSTVGAYIRHRSRSLDGITIIENEDGRVNHNYKMSQLNIHRPKPIMSEDEELPAQIIEVKEEEDWEENVQGGTGRSAIERF